MAYMPDTHQDADLRIRIPAHWPDTLHGSTDQMALVDQPGPYEVLALVDLVNSPTR
jgi:hypothetical protein